MLSQEFLKSAAWWLDHGFLLLPGQPGSKRLVAGFGAHRHKVKTPEAAAEWWGVSSPYNLAVLAGRLKIILDFDDQDLYQAWAAECPKESQTYTERTPSSGYHVFMRGVAPAGVHFKAGVELKSIVLVYPSVISGQRYTAGSGEIRGVDPVEVLSPLSAPGYPTPYVLTISQRSKVLVPRDDGVIERIKQTYTVQEVLHGFYPRLALRGQGRFLSARCPFHKAGKENNPSFWIDQERQTWGCHACGEHGDVINLYARLHGITNHESIKRLAGGLK